MLSNLRALFQTPPPPEPKAEAAPPSEAVVEAGGANAFLAAAAPFVPPTSFTPGLDKNTRRTLRGNDRLLYEAERALIPADAVPLYFPTGLVASDGSAKLCRDGIVLPTEKGVPARYQVDPFSLTLEATVARWRDILLRRADSAADLGVGFAGTFVPDKLTVLADWFDAPLVGPPPLMAGLDAMIADQLGLASAAETILPKFRADPRVQDLFRRIDADLSPYGMWRLFQILIARLGLAVSIGVSFAARRLERPKLSDLLFDLPVFEQLHETDSAVLLRLAAAVVAQKQAVGYDAWRAYRNESAPIAQGIMLYGDPLLGSFEQGQSSLCWWFTLFFREVHVSHKIRYDHGYAMDMHPTSILFIHSEEALEGPPLS